MHRVYGADASMDPTKIETIVIQECAERKTRHETRNQERKLTAQQKKEKKKQKFLADRANDLNVCVFKVPIAVVLS
jgi:U4/U6 small nuclear ribonucleoprotein PRP3